MREREENEDDPSLIVGVEREWSRRGGDGVEQSVTLVNWCTTRSTVPERRQKVWSEVDTAGELSDS